MNKRIDEWRQVPDFPDYEISDEGQVRWKSSQRPLRQFTFGNLYPHVSMMKDGKITKRSVHRLVAKAFIPNPKDKPCVNHIDNNPINNRADNLEWCTYKENSEHMVRQNRSIVRNGDNHPFAKMTVKKAEQLRKDRASGISLKDLSDKYGIGLSSVSLIARGKAWRESYKGEAGKRMRINARAKIQGGKAEV